MKQAGCEARQHSDQMSCAACELTWDMNDPDPPECLLPSRANLAVKERKPAPLRKPKPYKGWR